LTLLAQDKQRGFVVSYGTYIPTGCSVAAPVRDANGAIVSAINISGAREASVERDLEGPFKNELLAAAAEISRNLGYRGR
jgi:DNA-binding IclR family transcriptional regulator